MKPNKFNKHGNGKSGSFDPQAFLDAAGVAGKVMEYRRGEEVYSQGDAASTVMYIQKGGVKVSVVNRCGREAVVAVFGAGDFFGRGCMGTEHYRLGTASAVTSTKLVVVQKREMLRALHAEHQLCDVFIANLLAHHNRVEESLIVQLVNSTEERVARTLLLLARYGKQKQPDGILAGISQKTLASMVGTTRPRLNYFMNKFRKQGYIEYNGKIKVKKSLLQVVLRD